MLRPCEKNYIFFLLPSKNCDATPIWLNYVNSKHINSFQKSSYRCLVIVVIIHSLIVSFVFHLVADHLFATRHAPVEEFAQEEDDLDAADDREPRKEPHRASDETQLGLHLDLLVSLDVVEGRRVKVDVDQVQTRT